jgi:hypothetical protein
VGGSPTTKSIFWIFTGMRSCCSLTALTLECAAESLRESDSTLQTAHSAIFHPINGSFNGINFASHEELT